jgi:hypothetical protein
MRVLACLLLATALAAADQPGRHWFRVTVDQDGETVDYHGTSSLDESGFAEQVAKQPFVVLDDLVFYDDNGEVKPWSDNDPDVEPRVHIRCERIVSFMALKRDPRLDENGKPKREDTDKDKGAAPDAQKF